MLNEKISTVQKLITIGTAIEKYLTSQLKTYQITCNEWLVLTFLAESGPNGEIHDLRYNYLFDAIELCYLLENLEQKKLVQCQRHKSLKTIYGVKITASGEAVVEKTQPMVEKYGSYLLQKLDCTVDNLPLGLVF